MHETSARQVRVCELVAVGCNVVLCQLLLGKMLEHYASEDFTSLVVLTMDSRHVHEACLGAKRIFHSDMRFGARCLTDGALRSFYDRASNWTTTLGDLDLL